MKTLLLLFLSALGVAGTAWAQTPGGDVPAGSVAEPAAPQPSAPVGILILRAVAGYDATSVSFVSIQWVSNDGGYVVDSAGAKTSFINPAIGRIIYFDQTYYEEVDHNQYWVDWRAGLQSREVVVAPLETIHLTSPDIFRLQSEQTLLQDIVQRYAAGQTTVGPIIDALKDQISKLGSGLILQNGKWISAAEEAKVAPVSTPVIGEGNQNVTFTTTDGRKFVDAQITVTDSAVSVITADGGGAIAFDKMPADLSRFPASARAKIQAGQNRMKAEREAQSPAVEPTPVKTATSPLGWWATVQYYASLAWQKITSAVSGVRSSSANDATTNAPVSSPSPVSSTNAPPAAAAAPTVATLSSNAVVIIKGDYAEGTGFFAITPQGPVVFTNLHVIAGNPNFRILTSSGQQVETLSMKGASDRDLAMFSIVDNHYTYLELAPKVEQTTNVGDPTIIPGNSEGGEVTIKTDGKVVGIGPQLVEFDNPVYHGNSGGPVFDVKTGKVVAVVVAATRMDPKNDVDKSSFANANSAIKGPMRYFGFRIDTVPQWQDYDPNLFLSETLFLKTFHDQSRALDSFMNGAGYGNASSTEEGQPDAKYYMGNEKVRRAAENYQRTLQDHDKLTAVQELVWDFGTLVDENLDSVADTRRFYPYDQERAKFEVTYRTALKDEIQRAKDYVNNARSSNSGPHL